MRAFLLVALAAALVGCARNDAGEPVVPTTMVTAVSPEASPESVVSESSPVSAPASETGVWGSGDVDSDTFRAGWFNERYRLTIECSAGYFGLVEFGIGLGSPPPPGWPEGLDDTPAATFGFDGGVTMTVPLTASFGGGFAIYGPGQRGESAPVLDLISAIHGSTSLSIEPTTADRPLVLDITGAEAAVGKALPRCGL